jgi:hypothetical protein
MCRSTASHMMVSGVCLSGLVSVCLLDVNADAPLTYIVGSVDIRAGLVGEILKREGGRYMQTVSSSHSFLVSLSFPRNKMAGLTEAVGISRGMVRATIAASISVRGLAGVLGNN